MVNHSLTISLLVTFNCVYHLGDWLYANDFVKIYFRLVKPVFRVDTGLDIPRIYLDKCITFGLPILDDLLIVFVTGLNRYQANFLFD